MTTETKKPYKQVRMFACQCSDRSKRHMAALETWVGKTFLALRLGPPEQKWLVTRLLSELEHRYSAEVKDIAFDQWGGMTITSSPSMDAQGEPLRIWMQFDLFEDGLRLALRRLYKEYGMARRWTDDE